MPPRVAAAGRPHGRLGGALLLRAGAGAGPGEGRLPRYTWHDAYAELRERLDALGRRLGGAYRVLVDANQHVDREGAARAGVGFYGKNTMLITRRHGSWVVLGTLVTDVEIEPSPPLELDCGDCRLCIDACPTGALDEPGTLDATRCLSYWTQAPAPIPEDYREPLGDMVYGCDICQDVCPWNRGDREAATRRAAPRRRAGRLARRLAAVGADDLGRALRPPLRPAQRCRATCAGTRSSRSGTRARPEMPASPSRTPRATTTLLREHAEWALALRLEGRALVSHDQRVQAERWLAWVRLGAVPFAVVPGRSSTSGRTRRASSVWTWLTTAVLAVGAVALCVLSRRRICARRAREAALWRRSRSTSLIVSSFVLALHFQRATPIRQVLILVLIEAAFRYGIRGGLWLTVASVPVLVGYEALRAEHFDERFAWTNVTLQVGIRS